MSSGSAYTNSSGAIAHLYEAILNPSIDKIKGATFQTLSKFLSELAHYSYLKKKKQLSINDIDIVFQKYKSTYDVNIDIYYVLSQLKEHDILRDRGGDIIFAEPWVYYYYIARYISENLQNNSSTTVRGYIESIIKEIEDEDNANILMFLCYTTKEPFLLDQLKSTSQSILFGKDIDALNKEAEFLDKLYPGNIVIGFTSKDHAERKSKRLKARDDADFEKESKTVSHDNQETGSCLGPKAKSQDTQSGHRNASEVLRAFRMVEMLGQVLGNFGGGMESDVKTPLMTEAYYLGLRTMGYFLQHISARTEYMLENITRLIARDMAKARQNKARLEAGAGSEAQNSIARVPYETDDAKRDSEKQARSILFNLSTFTAYCLLKHISYSVGSKELGRTYEKILEKNLDNVAVRLIHLSIRMDQFHVIPMEEIKEILKMVKDNPFSLTLLKIIVADYMYINKVPRRQELEASSILGLSIEPEDGTGPRYQPPAR